MCGITGLININGEGVSPEVVKLMTDVITHRGPDGEGVWTEGNVGLGHRRLAIIDLSDAGSQPMISSEGRFILSYNGEVYNYKEIRSELLAQGHYFYSDTDSEVVLKALATWGPAAIDRFNGMFSFALWDRDQRELLLARDRYGIKPLYFYQQGSQFAFGSEQKAITVLPSFAKKVDKKALLEYFTFQNIFTNRTLLDGVNILPAGHYAVLDLKKTKPKLQTSQYWDFNFSETQLLGTQAEYREELDRLFRQAVKRQLVGDVEVGAYLSGGMDSGSITAIAASEFPYMKTFTCGFDLNSASGIELGYDERSVAEYMSYFFKTEHYEMVLKSGDMERVLPELAWHLEEPRVGQSYPNYYAAKLASKFVKIVMSGAGGDEIFAGYPWRYYRAAVNEDFESYIDKYYLYWQRLLDNRHLREIFEPIKDSVSDVWTRDIFKGIFQSQDAPLGTPEHYINNSLYFEAKTFLHGLLVVEDKLSMAHSLETRVPFLDNDLVDFAMHCPIKYKLQNLASVARVDENDATKKFSSAFTKTNDGKKILREVMSRYIPEGVSQAQKKGFSAPDASWFKGESMAFVERKVLDKNARVYEFFDFQAVKKQVDLHLSGAENKRLFVWSLLNFEEYLANFN